jgi:hypothetical protein
MNRVASDIAGAAGNQDRHAVDPLGSTAIVGHAPDSSVCDFCNVPDFFLNQPH